MVECQTCTRWFNNDGAAMRHMDAVNHWQDFYACETCNVRHVEEVDSWQHMDDYKHWMKYDCEACNNKFNNPIAARQHMDKFNHWRKHWCQPCQKGFQNENNLRQHLHGSTHCRVECPFCKRVFTTVSGVAHHVETGSCPNAPNLNRQKVFEIINRADTRGAITNKMIAWRPEQNGEHIATSATWNGSSYECYICHRGYQTLRALNQHLSSPAHKQRIYHCFGRRCPKQFTALGQLFSHLESETCGAMRFNALQKNASAIMTGQRMIAFG